MDRVCPTRKQSIIVRFLKLLPSEDTMEFSIYGYSIDYILHSHIPSKRSSITVLYIDSVPVVKVWIDLGVIRKKPSKSNGGRPGFGRAKWSHAAIIAVCFVPTPPSSLKVNNPTF